MRHGIIVLVYEMADSNTRTFRRLRIARGMKITRSLYRNSFRGIRLAVCFANFQETIKQFNTNLKSDYS